MSTSHIHFKTSLLYLFQIWFSININDNKTCDKTGILAKYKL